MGHAHREPGALSESALEGSSELASDTRPEDYTRLDLLPGACAVFSA